MSIRMRGVCVPGARSGEAQPLFENLDMDIPDGARVGILGGPKSGKSTLLRLMCGTATAEKGSIERSSRVSWPIPLSTFISPTATVAQNIRFIARLYGVSEAGYFLGITQPFGLGEFLGAPVRSCPKFVQQRLALGLALGIDCDIYLFDGSLGGADRTFKKEAAELVDARLADRGCVLATALPAEAEKKCDSLYVLEAGRARYFADAEEGLKHFKDTAAAQKGKSSSRRQRRQSDEDDEADALGDIDLISAAVTDAVD